MQMISKLMSCTMVLVMAYLVLKNYKGGSKIINTMGGVYTDAIKALQGR